MRTRRLGTTGLEPSELGFGCAGFWARPVFPEASAVRLVHQALDLGITLFDTSPHYARGEAERRLGAALRSSSNGTAIIATKAGSLVDDRGRVTQDLSPAAITTSVEGSLRRLGVDHIDLLQLHSPPAADVDDDVLDCLGALQRAGTVRACGVSGYDDALLARVRASSILATSMFGFSVVDAARAAAIDELAASGTGFLASAPLAHGRIRRRQPVRRRVADLVFLARDPRGHSATMRRARALRFVDDVEGWTAAEVSLAYVLRHPHVSSAVFGTTDEAHLAQNVAACDRELPAEVVEAIDRATQR